MFKRILNKIFFKEIVVKDFYPIFSTDVEVDNLSKTDYSKLYLSTQYVAINVISDTIAGLDYGLFNNDKEINNPLLEKIDYDLLKAIVSNMLLAGVAYIYINRLGNKIDSLEVLRPDGITWTENEDGSLNHFIYQARKSYKINKEDLMILNMYNPLQTYPFYLEGVSPIQAVALQAEMDLTAVRWNKQFFKQGATVGGAIETDQSINPETKARIARKWREKFQGIDNSHKIVILDNGLKYKEFNINTKELDFVNSRKYTRDEILSIFKVPKSIIGLTDGVNYANAKVAERTFYKVCIQPLTRQIENVLNKQLFSGIGNIKFQNVVPIDREAIIEDLNNGAITINEYRGKIGLEKINNGDILKINPLSIMEAEQSKPQKQVNKLNLKSIKENIKGTQERKEKLWTEKIKRTDKYEIKFKQAVKNIFDIQKGDILKKLKNKKDIKKVDTTFDPKKYKLLWKISLKPIFDETIQNEGNKALESVGVQTMFQVGFEGLNKYIDKNINRIAKDVDEETKKQIAKILKEGNKDGLGIPEIAKNISSKFEDFKITRSEKIARTEITDVSNEAIEDAYKQSGVVEEKEVLTALDEKTCSICLSFSGKRYKLGEDIYKKGDSAGGVVNDYITREHPSFHPNCRCTLIPVIK